MFRHTRPIPTVRHTRSASSIRRLGATVALALGVGMLAPVAASATQPVVTDPPPYTVVETNPCTGLAHEVTLDWQYDEIFNTQNYVSSDTLVVTTSDGYEGTGVAHWRISPDGVLRINAQSVLTSDEGSMIIRRERVVVDLPSGTPLVDDLVYDCIRP